MASDTYFKYKVKYFRRFSIHQSFDFVLNESSRLRYTFKKYREYLITEHHLGIIFCLVEVVEVMVQLVQPVCVCSVVTLQIIIITYRF